MLQIDVDDQGDLQVDCSEGEDSDQGILDWLGVFLDVQVNMVDLEYVKKDDDDEVSNSLEQHYTLEMKEFSMIWMSDHALFHSFVERAMSLLKAARDDAFQEQQIEWFLDGIEDKYKILKLYQDQPVSLILVVMFGLEFEMLISLHH